MSKIKLIILFQFFIVIHTYAQKLCGEFSYDLIADNREYFDVYATPQTILGGRMDLHGGFELDSLHSVFVGLSHFIEFGHPIDGHKPVLDLYYRYYDKHFDIRLGSFPRKDLLHYPLIMLTDSVEYYRPNIQGTLGTLRGKWGYQTVWIDWTSRQTETVRETFLTGFSGIIKLGPVFFEDHFHYWHRAGMANDSIKDIRDNNTIGAFLGIDLSQYLFLDSVSISSGLVTTSDKIRPADPYTSQGILTRLVTRYKRFGIDLTYYWGDAPSLEFGDRLYTAKNYLRTDLMVMPFKSEHVTSKCVLGIHLVDGDIDYSQQIFVSVKINNKSR